QTETLVHDRRHGRRGHERKPFCEVERGDPAQGSHGLGLLVGHDRRRSLLGDVKLAPEVKRPGTAYIRLSPFGGPTLPGSAGSSERKRVSTNAQICAIAFATESAARALGVVEPLPEPMARGRIAEVVADDGRVIPHLVRDGSA